MVIDESFFGKRILLLQVSNSKDMSLIDLCFITKFKVIPFCCQEKKNIDGIPYDHM